MHRAAVAWLHRELPKLVAAGVLTPEAAEALRRHYGPVEDAGLGRRVASALIAVLGSLLLGGGVVLLLAHNWDLLSRGSRTGLLLGLLLLTQGLAAFVLLRRAASAAWRESAGVLQVAAVASAVALVAQTYHVPGDLGSFYRTVLLLSLPLVYLLDAAAVSVLCSAGLVALATTFHGRGEHVVAWWALAAAGVPYLVKLTRTEGESWRTALAVVLAVAALFIGGTINATASAWEGLWSLHGLGLLAIAHALGSAESGEAPEGWRRRLRAPAFVGLVVLGLLLTFEWPWNGLAFVDPGDLDAGGWATAAVALGLGVWATLHAVHLLRTGQLHLGLTSAAWVVGAIAYVFAIAGQEPWARLVLDLWLLAVGITGLADGFRTGRIVRANAGLLALSALAVARFFDADVSFLLRGLGFILVGLGFLTVNLVLVRRGRRPAVSHP
jgi:hypothetical protein